MGISAYDWTSMCCKAAPSTRTMVIDDTLFQLNTYPVCHGAYIFL